MLKYKLILAYDGTRYCGWQTQPNALSIQALIEENLSILLKENIAISGAGRTDAGVHALGQVAHFETSVTLDPRKFLHSLNGMLPRDIRLKEVHVVSNDFHARKSALSKEYHYHLWLEKVDDPFLMPFHFHHYEPLSLPLLREAAKCFVGKLDFTTFANVNGSAKTAIREIKRLDVIEQKGGIRLEFEGDGFLYKMVRNITGTILEVAKGKRDLKTIDELFNAKDRRQGGLAAPARGLFLVKVNYGM